MGRKSDLVTLRPGRRTWKEATEENQAAQLLLCPEHREGLSTNGYNWTYKGKGRVWEDGREGHDAEWEPAAQRSCLNSQ